MNNVSEGGYSLKKFLTYKYRIKPNSIQTQRINSLFNDFKMVKDQYAKDLRENNCNGKLLKDLLFVYKNKFPHLKESDGSALINALFMMKDLGNDFIINHYKTDKKCYSYKTSFLNYGNSVKILENILYLPTVGEVPIVIHRPIPKEYRLVSCSISKENNNSYYACIHVERIINSKSKSIDETKIIGLDYSNKHFVIDDNGNIYPIPHFYRDNEEKLIDLKKKLQNCNVGSRNYNKISKRISKLYSHIRHGRKDWLHKMSTYLINKYDIICVESLSINDILKKRNLTKSTLDNSYAEFIKMLEYKSVIHNKKLIKIDRWFPSSKMCSNCGTINTNLKLKDIKWICPDCKAVHDRDINAAINIRNEGLKLHRGIGGKRL